MRAVRWLLWIVGGIVVLAVVGVLALPPLTGGWVKGRVEAAIQDATGRAVAIDSLSWRIVPGPRASIEGLGIANAPGGDAAVLARVGRAEVDLQLWPLLGGDIVVREIVVTDPVANLEILPDGTPNWAFPSSSTDTAGGDGAGGGGSITVERLAVSGLRITFRDATGDGRVVAMTDGTIEGAMSPTGIRLAARAVLDGQPVTLDATTAGLDQIMAGSGTMRIALDSPFGTLAADGSGNGSEFSGRVDAAIPSLAAVFDYVGLPAEDRPALDAVTFGAAIRGGQGRIDVSELSLALDEMSLTGALSLIDGAPPRIEGAIDIAELDIAKLQALTGPGGGTGSGAPAESGGPDAPADFSVLGEIDADLRITVAGVDTGAAQVGRLAAHIVSEGRRLGVTIDETAIFGGTVALDLRVDDTGAAPRVEASADLAQIDLAQLARFANLDTIGLRNLAGTLVARIDLATQGATQGALVAGLDGTAEIVVRNGAMVYQPAGAAPLALTGLGFESWFGGFDADARAVGSAVLNGRQVRFEQRMSGMASAAEGGTVPVFFSFESEPATARFEGRANPMAATGAGNVSVSVPSVRAALDWLAQPAMDLPVDRVRFEGGVAVSANAVEMSEATFAFDDLTGSGSLALSLAAVPSASGNLSFGVIDLDRLLGTAGGAGAAPAEPSPGGWSSEPMIPYEMLRAATAELSVAAEGLVYSGTRTGPTRLDLRLTGGVLAVDLAETAVNEGTLSVRIGADAGARSTSLAFRADGIAARPLLETFTGIEWLSGTLDAALDVTARGDSQQALMSSLDGAGSVLFSDGAIRGVNIAAVLRDPLQALANPSILESQETDFAQLGGTFRLSGGTLTTDDLAMLAPILRMTGAGSVGLPAQAVDMTFRPSLVGTLQGQGGEMREGLTVPIRVSGRFDNLQYGLDVQPQDVLRFMEDPQSALDALRGLGDLTNIPALQGLLGGEGGGLPGLPGLQDLPGLFIQGEGGPAGALPGLGVLPGLIGGGQPGAAPALPGGLLDLVPGLGAGQAPAVLSQPIETAPLEAGPSDPPPPADVLPDAAPAGVADEPEQPAGLPADPPEEPAAEIPAGDAPAEEAPVTEAEPVPDATEAPVLSDPIEVPVEAAPEPEPAPEAAPVQEAPAEDVPTEVPADVTEDADAATEPAPAPAASEEEPAVEAPAAEPQPEPAPAPAGEGDAAEEEQVDEDGLPEAEEDIILIRPPSPSD